MERLPKIHFDIKSLHYLEFSPKDYTSGLPSAFFIEPWDQL